MEKVEKMYDENAYIDIINSFNNSIKSLKTIKNNLTDQIILLEESIIEDETDSINIAAYKHQVESLKQQRSIIVDIIEKISLDIDVTTINKVSEIIKLKKQTVGRLNREIRTLEKNSNQGKIQEKGIYVQQLYTQHLQTLKKQKSNIIDSIKNLQSFLDEVFLYTKKYRATEEEEDYEELNNAIQSDVIETQATQKSLEAEVTKPLQADHIIPMSTEKVKVENIKIIYNHKEGQYEFSYDKVENNERKNISAIIKLKDELIYENEESGHKRVKIYTDIGCSPEFCENVDLHVCTILAGIGRDNGLNLVQNLYEGKLKIELKYNFLGKSNDFHFKRYILQIINAKKQKNICDVEIICQNYKKSIMSGFSKIKKPVAVIAAASLVIPIVVGILGGIGNKLFNNRDKKNSDESKTEHNFDVSKNTNKVEKPVNKNQSTSNAILNDENKEKTTQNSLYSGYMNDEYMEKVQKDLDYYDENYNYDIELRIADKMNNLKVSRERAKDLVRSELMFEVSRIEEKKKQEEMAKKEEESSKNTETQETVKADEPSNEIDNKDTTLSTNINPSINLSEISAYKISDKIDLNGKVLTGDSQGNGKKCYPDKLNCDYFEISTIVVWSGSQVLDIIRQDKGQNDINTNDLYKKYGADIDIVFNFNGCFNDKPNKYENMGWININELSPVTIEQKQAIAESKDDTKTENEEDNINKDDSASIRKFYNELEAELCDNEILSGYKLTFHM